MSLVATVPYYSDHHGLRVVWLVTVVAFVVVQLRAGLRFRPGAERHDRGSVLAVAAGIGGGIAVLAISRSAGGWLPIRPRAAAFWAGEALCVAGIGVRGWAIWTLGALFTPIVRTIPNQPVVTNGPYRFVRHPSYTGLLLFLTGIGCVLGDWIGLAAVVIGSTAGLLYRIRVEEAALTEAIGEPYLAFAATRKRLVPGVW
jgi:protein-S-isoprenylcysteine O-methyltransferase Ste14